MLEPVSPSHIPNKPSKSTDEKPLAQADNISDSDGYRFNFFGSLRKKKEKKRSESNEENVYNDDKAVKLNLSPEAEKELEKQRRLKEENTKNQDAK